MSWIADIFDRLNLRQLKLLLWFLDGIGETNYVESNDVRFEWVDEWLTISGPQIRESATIAKLITSKAFRQELQSQIGRLATQERLDRIAALLEGVELDDVES